MAGRAKKQVGLEGIETGPLTLPKMDRISMTFALMLDSFIIGNIEDETGTPLDDDTYIICNYCGEAICHVDPGDSMRVLLNTALAHSC